jgi:hypoxanthine phosphoribosyltransferase
LKYTFDAFVIGRIIVLFLLLPLEQKILAQKVQLKILTLQLQNQIEVIEILDKKFELYLNREEIHAKISDLAFQLNQKYLNQEVVFVAVLDGSFMFVSELMKQIQFPCQVSFIKMKSYEGMQTSGNIKELIGLTSDLKKKNVIILEDIVDTGNTIDTVVELLQSHSPLNIEIASLFFKPTAFKGVHTPTYTCFSITDEFIVGFGLDYNGYGRNLESIYQYKGNIQTLPLC